MLWCTLLLEGKQDLEVYEKILKIMDQGSSAGYVSRGIKWLLSILYSPVYVTCIVTEGPISREAHSLCLVVSIS